MPLSKSWLLSAPVHVIVHTSRHRMMDGSCPPRGIPEPVTSCCHRPALAIGYLTSEPVGGRSVFVSLPYKEIEQILLVK